MDAAQATAEVFWTAFQALSKHERDAFLEKLFNDRTLKEDLIDLAILEQRADEPSRSLTDYLANQNQGNG
jgi:hypothetical protein